MLPSRNYGYRCFVVAASWIVVSAFAASPAWSQESSLAGVSTAADTPRQLDTNGQAFSDIYTALAPQLSPDGQRVVYVHDAVTDNANELYSVGRYAGAPVRLSASLPAGTSITWFGISASSSRVVYLVDQETPGKLELWSVPIAGPAGSSIKISPPLPFFGSVLAGSIPPVMSPDGAYVVFYADSATDGVAAVWSARVDGSSAAVRLSPNPAIGGGATYLQVAPLQVTADSSRAVFTGDFLVDEQNTLWSAPLDGLSPAIKLSFVADHLAADVAFFALTPDGSQALFLFDRAIDERMELFRIPVTGAGGAQLSPVSTTSPSSNGDVTTFVVAPDSSRVVFRADIQVDSRFDLWSVSLSGNSTEAVIISPALVTGQEVSSPVFSPDSSRVVFLADDGANNVSNLWSAPADGSSGPVRLNPAIGSTTADVAAPRFTNDGARVVYEVRDIIYDPFRIRLWTVPSTGPLAAAAELTTAVSTTRTVNRWTLANDDQVVFIGALVDSDDRELYRVPADGSTPWQTLASSSATSVIDANLLQLTSSGSHAVFTAATTTGKRLMEVALDASAPAAPIDVAPPTATSGILDALVWPTAVGDGVLYVGDYGSNYRYDLWIFEQIPIRIFADGFEQ